MLTSAAARPPCRRPLACLPRPAPPHPAPPHPAPPRPTPLHPQPRYASLLTELMEDYGGWKRASGVVHDHEGVCDATVKKLQEAHPHLIDIVCQAHGEKCTGVGVGGGAGTLALVPSRLMPPSPNASPPRLGIPTGLNHAVEDLCKLPVLKEMFEAVHLIIMTIRSSKALKREYKSVCKTLAISAPLQPKPDHRFAYSVLEARCVKAALRPLAVLFSDPSTMRKHQEVEGIEQCAALAMGTYLLGDGTNKFSLSELLDMTVTALELMGNTIASLEADKPMASMALPLWTNIMDGVTPLGNDLQRSRRGRGAAAAAARCDFITEFLTARRQQYTTPELIAATLVDPANAIAGPDGGAWLPPKEWFTGEDVSAAAKAVARIANGLSNGDGPAARMQFMSLLAYGFDSDTIGLCQMVGGGGGGVVGGGGGGASESGAAPRWVNVQQRRLVWETELREAYPQLAPIVGRLLSQHATSCAVERAWAKWGKLFTPTRSSMLAATAQHYMFITNAWHLKNRPSANMMVPEEAFWMQQEAPSGSDTETQCD
jgi:hypothetical protein